MGEDELIGNSGISVAQIESAITFIIKLRANQIGISQEEFNNICSKIKFSSWFKSKIFFNIYYFIFFSEYLFNSFEKKIWWIILFY